MIFCKKAPRRSFFEERRGASWCEVCLYEIIGADNDWVRAFPAVLFIRTAGLSVAHIR